MATRSLGHSTCPWHHPACHVERYEHAAKWLKKHYIVADYGSGPGFGAAALMPYCFGYIGYDKPGRKKAYMPGRHVECDLDAPDWLPEVSAHMSLCFEVLEHVHDPQRVAQTISDHTWRVLFVAVPTVPTKHLVPGHLHDFTIDDIPKLFPDLVRESAIPMPAERSHLFRFRKRWA